MDDALDRYTRISAGFDARIRGVQADQWFAFSPSCPEWDVRALVTHVIGNHRRMLGTLGEQHGADAAGTDLPAAWTQARTAMLAAMGDPVTAARVVTAPFGQVPFSRLVGALLSGDTLFHTWDLARATGQDERLDTAACEQVLMAMAPLDVGIRGPGRFADKIEPPAGADAQTRLLCFGGRQA